ncbi:unnamed protein product [Caenorhabditis brenneri]
MKLLKYPVLVFDNIIKQLDPIPLVSLSFCSKKTRERIKRVSFAIEDAWFCNESVGKRGYYFGVKFPSQQILYIIFQSTPSQWFKRNSEKFQIGDTVYNCRFQLERHLIHLGSIGYKKASLFFNYIFELVRARINAIVIDLNRLNNTKLFLSEPCFNVQKIHLVGKSIPKKKVIELYDCFEKPVLETRVDPHIKSLSPTSKLLQSENLGLENSKSISIEHLLNFTGKYIILECSSLREEQIVTFIKHWLNGNYPNLEGAYIATQGEFVFKTEKVLDEFNTKQWNPAERAQNFIFDATFCYGRRDEYSVIDCTNGHDLERSDGLLATFFFMEPTDGFRFVVWHNRFPS